MSTHQTTEEVIASALALFAEERRAVVGAIQRSLVDDSSDEPAAEVEAAWKEELDSRLNDVQSGCTDTIPADEAERMISATMPSLLFEYHPEAISEARAA